MSTTNEIIEKLKSLTLLEAAELVSQIEKTFGVDASAPVGGGVVVATQNASQSAETEVIAEEKTVFDVILEDAPSKDRVKILRVIRKLTPLSLSEAKEFLNTLPKPLLESIAKEEAESATAQLNEAGGKARVE
jgi:large subunit ribosomal protein L7/L12